MLQPTMPYLLPLLAALIIPWTSALNNGLALTPPMGFLTWERFECNTGCMDDPDSCIGERLLMTMADAMVSEGFKDAGYEFINIDDCWPADNRDEHGRLQPDPRRFPSGFKALADYIHSKGLKFGIYEDVGRHTCAGAPGTLGHYDVDAQTFADWGVDMLKFDGCNAELEDLNYGYPAMGHSLNKTGRPIVYSCEWNLYVRAKGAKANYSAVAEHCNTFRVYGDIYDAYQSIMSVINWYGDDTGNFSETSGPGHFNDADMVVVGNYAMSRDEERVQFGMWAIFASPLLISADLRHMRAESKALLQNRRVIAINQDRLGIPGRRVMKMYNDDVQIWTRQVEPLGSYAVAILNTRQQFYPLKASFLLHDIGLKNTKGYNVTEVFDGGHVGYLKPDEKFTSLVNPSGIVLVKTTPLH